VKASLLIPIKETVEYADKIQIREKLSLDKPDLKRCTYEESLEVQNKTISPYCKGNKLVISTKLKM